jgi:hypothetical protein
LPAREEARSHCTDAVRKLNGLTGRQRQVLDMVMPATAAIAQTVRQSWLGLFEQFSGFYKWSLCRV